MKLLSASSTALFGLLFAKAKAMNLKGCVAPGEFDPNRDYFPDKVSPSNSLFWDIQYFPTYKILRNEIEGETYVLYQCGTEPPAGETGHEHFISVPLQDGVALQSTTHIPHFELLGLRTEIKAWIGTDLFISSPCVKKLIEESSLIVVEKSDDIAAVDALKQSVGPGIVAFTNSRTSFQSNLPNITVSAFTEAGNIAIYEWNKYLATFFNYEKEANDLYIESSERYLCYGEEAQRFVEDQDSGVKPTLIWASYTNYTGVDGWSVANCPNYYCEYADLCGADILSSRDGTIDFFGSKLLTTDQLVELAKDAEFWIYPSGNWDEAYAAYGDILDGFKSVQNQQVYDTQGSGSNTWFENRLVEYDVVLQDFCAVVGTGNPIHQRTWFRNIFTELTGFAEQLTCPDVEAALETRATPCFRFVCFSGDSMVQLQDESVVSMNDLKIGDYVADGSGSYSRVYSFGHYSKGMEGRYLQLHMKDSNQPPLEISHDHMVFVGPSRAVPASSVSVGDHLQLSSGKRAVVTKVVTVTKQGAFAPFTESGSIVVNGVIASSYAAVNGDENIMIGGVKVLSHHWAAHLFQAPHRLVCALTTCENESYNEEGMSFWIAGPLKVALWFIEQNDVVKALLLFPVIPLLLLCVLAEMLVSSSVGVALLVLAATLKAKGAVFGGSTRKGAKSSSD